MGNPVLEVGWGRLLSELPNETDLEFQAAQARRRYWEQEHTAAVQADDYGRASVAMRHLEEYDQLISGLRELVKEPSLPA